MPRLPNAIGALLDPTAHLDPIPVSILPLNFVRVHHGLIAAVCKDLNDYALGHALDDLCAFGVSQLFGTVGFGIALEHRLLGGLAHLDSTSISVSGQYEQASSMDGEPAVIQLTHGQSKDKRPDLKQAGLSLVVNGPSQMPIWMDALDGNSSDKMSFHETIRKVRAFQKQINMEADFKWVADSSLFQEA